MGSGVGAPDPCQTPAMEVSDVIDRTCSVESCDRPVSARGLCKLHYERVRRGYPLERALKAEHCADDGCDRAPFARGWCQMHYDRWRRGQPVEGPRLRALRKAPCSVEGCEDVSNAKGFCPKHYHRWVKFGDPLVYNGRIPEHFRGKWTKGQADLFYRFGLTPDDWEALFESQGRKCPGCHTTEPDGVGWCVDHCHVSGVVRAILCHRCNTSLGLCNEDPDTLLRLADLASEFARMRIA